MVGSNTGERKHLMEGGINDFGGFHIQCITKAP